MKWTGSWGAGAVSGTLAAFNVHILTRLAHVAAVQAWGLPVVLFMTDRLIDPPEGRPRRRDAAILAIAILRPIATAGGCTKSAGNKEARGQVSASRP